ncbi:MAG: malonyl-ACP O-methyltransferase BioC [Gammaproteobacteria bacterium]|nr:malonyl-ACP O-methyltransferase BioC [Gammaproteobacteria bacterium]
MPIDRKAVQRVFGRAAYTYSDAAVLDQSVGGELLSRLDLLKASPARILDAGCGGGYCTGLLRQRYPDAEIVGIDLSLYMLQATAQKHANTVSPRVLTSAEHLPFADARFDLVFSNLMLPWCDIGAALVELQRVMCPESALMFSAFGPDTLIELRQAWGKVDELPHVHDFYDMHDIGDALLHAGFAEPIVDVDRITVTYASIDAMICELRNSGATNIHPQRRKSLTGKKRFQRFCAAVENCRDEDQRISLNYEVIYGHAWIAPTQDSDAVTISLDSLQAR